MKRLCNIISLFLYMYIDYRKKASNYPPANQNVASQHRNLQKSDADQDLPEDADLGHHAVDTPGHGRLGDATHGRPADIGRGRHEDTERDLHIADRDRELLLKSLFIHERCL